ILRPDLYDAVTGLDVVQQEITEGVNDLVSQSVRYAERSAIDHRLFGRRWYGFDMAGIAADLPEQSLPRAGGGSRGQSGVARGHFRSANELSEVVDVCQSEIVG